MWSVHSPSLREEVGRLRSAAAAFPRESRAVAAGDLTGFVAQTWAFPELDVDVAKCGLGMADAKTQLRYWRVSATKWLYAWAENAPSQLEFTSADAYSIVIAMRTENVAYAEAYTYYPRLCLRARALHLFF